MSQRSSPGKFGVISSREASRQELEGVGLIGVIDYWESLRRGDMVPRWQYFDWKDVHPKLVPGIAVYDILEGGKDFRVRFWGTAATDLFGFDPSGQLVSDVNHYGVLTNLYRDAPKVMAAAKPIGTVHTFVLKSGIELEIPLIRLPFSEDGQSVSKILTLENLRQHLTPRG